MKATTLATKKAPTKRRGVASQNRKAIGTGLRVVRNEDGDFKDANQYIVYAPIAQPDDVVELRRLAAGNFLERLPGILKTAPKEIRLHFQTELTKLMKNELTEKRFVKFREQYMTVMIRENPSAFIALARLMVLLKEHVTDTTYKHPFTVNLGTILMLKDQCKRLNVKKDDLNLKELCMGLSICGRTNPELTESRTPSIRSCDECSSFVDHNPLMSEAGKDAMKDASAEGPRRPGRCGGVISFVAMLAYLRAKLNETVKENADAAREDGKEDQKFCEDLKYRYNPKRTVNNLCNSILYFCSCFRDIGRTCEKARHLTICSLLAHLAPESDGELSRWVPWTLVRAIDLALKRLVVRTEEDKRAVLLQLSPKAKKNVGTALTLSVELPVEGTGMREALEELATAVKRGLNLPVDAEFEYAQIGKDSSGFQGRLSGFTKEMFDGKGGLTPYANRYQGARDAKNYKLLDNKLVRRRYGHKKLSAMVREYAKVSKCTDVLMLSPENELPPAPEERAALVAVFEYTTLDGTEDHVLFVDASRFGSADAIDLAIYTMYKMCREGFDAQIKKLEAEKEKPAKVKADGSIDTAIDVMKDAKEVYGAFVMRRPPSAEKIAKLEQLDRESRPDSWARLEALVCAPVAAPLKLDNFDFGIDEIPEGIRRLIEENL